MSAIIRDRQRFLGRARLAAARHRRGREFWHVRVGDMGSRVRRAYTAMGDAEQKLTLSASWSGRPRAPGSKMWYSGKDEAITVYEPLEKDNAELQLWQEGLRGLS